MVKRIQIKNKCLFPLTELDTFTCFTFSLWIIGFFNHICINNHIYTFSVLFESFSSGWESTKFLRNYILTLYNLYWFQSWRSFPAIMQFRRQNGLFPFLSPFLPHPILCLPPFPPFWLPLGWSDAGGGGLGQIAPALSAPGSRKPPPASSYWGPLAFQPTL